MRKTEIKVGIMTVIGIIVLFFGALYLNDQSLTRNKTRLTIYFNEAEGLNKGDLVKVRGVKKGQIEKVSLQNNKVVVSANIDNDISIRDDYEIQIRNLSLMGGQFLEINPGTGNKPADTNNLKGTPEGSVTRMLGEMVKIVIKLDTTINKINQILEKKDLDKLLSNTTELTGNLNDVVIENRKDLKATVRNLRTLSVRLNSLITSPEIDMAKKSFGRIGPQVEDLVIKLDRIADDMEYITSNVKKSKGTLGKVVNEDDLYKDLKQTVKEVKNLLEDIKKNPQRYIKVRVF
ncbi:MAG: MCE family protein [Candidatus Coatesbacteria bacterium]|nr:MCE family protein [Candidatus Coatesbacteria bacterium]